jgi:hypothetical protein
MTDNTVTKIKERPPAKSLIEQAILSGAGIDVIERLLAAERSVQENEARKAFNLAFSEFKKNPPAVLKNQEVGYGKTSYRHEDLAEMMAVVDPALAAHGLWARWKINSSVNLVTVTCVIGHSDGHMIEDCTLSQAPDTSGSKNPIQAIGSAVTYLQRYTLKAALGVAAAKDTDAVDVANKFITQDQVEEIVAILNANPHLELARFLKLADSNSLNEILAVKHEAAMLFLNKYRTDNKNGKKK